MTNPRIVAGAWRGRPLSTPKGRTVRPTSARMREAVFNILADRIRGSHFLDIFAGSGAMGLEALSRGADFAVFVEKDQAASAAIRDNIKRLGAEDRAEIVQCDAIIAPIGARRFEIAYLDPPYASGLLEPALAHLGNSGCVEGLVLLEYPSNTEPPTSPFFEVERTRRYGAGSLAILRPLG